MKLNTKINTFFIAMAALTLTTLVIVSLLSFRHFSIVAARNHLSTAAEIVRVGLTESMINGVIDKRAHLLLRIAEVQQLTQARVVRSPGVIKQFGPGLSSESAIGEVERRVMLDGKPEFELYEEDGVPYYRATIPYIASSHGSPNCLQCHQVLENTVLGAITVSMSLEQMRETALMTSASLVGAVALAILATLFFLRRLLRPLIKTAHEIDIAVHRAVEGDFRSAVTRHSNDEIGRIADDMNRLMSYLREGLTTIGDDVSQLIRHTPAVSYNLLTSTVEMVTTLVNAAHFKQAIEEDETKAEIYKRINTLLIEQFNVTHFSLYEVTDKGSHIQPIMVDGESSSDCKWCDSEIMVRAEGCRARRTGHTVNSIESPGICNSFRPPADESNTHHICIPVMQSGTVGSVLQLVAHPEDQEKIQQQMPFIDVYLRESAPVLEAKRLMETLRESTLRDAMTGLHNRRFLEEYMQTLIANSNRNKTHLSILMLDLDYFKMVNDKLGHDAGDTVLKALSQVLLQSVRTSDLVIRYGGEEFLIILQNTEGESADAVAEKIRKSVEDLRVQTAGTTLQKTISIGISDFPSDSDTFWQAVKYADVALYRAKDEGRNRVIRFNKDMWKDGTTY